ncbi:hypothetical protein NQ317_002339 [Molorchus minor]|uniref:Uncharacterized protein n=1 Tax=Molorchus minor TaxID=1323400 RepID=A0ABQ9JWM8_9CUCU|nr:hypothetical protein NQ317_002339 [Molorchus minor]
MDMFRRFSKYPMLYEIKNILMFMGNTKQSAAYPAAACMCVVIIVSKKDARPEDLQNIAVFLICGTVVQ